jgi:Outer membrane protein beta-barrel domain
MLSAVPYAARSDWTLGAEAALRHDSNVGNSASSSDVVGDSTLGAKLSLLNLFPLGEDYSLSVGGDVRGELFRTLTGLNSASVEALVSLKRKWGYGAFAPWARLGLSVGRSSYDDSYRNAWDYRVGVATGWRVDERLNIWGEYAFERLAAATQEQEVPSLSGDAFSQSSHNVQLNAEYSLSERSFVSLGLLGRRGDVVSTTEGNSQIFAAARALAEDPAFGPESYAYRIGGTSFGFRAGIHFSPTPHCLLGFGFERLITHADGGTDYNKSIPEITWGYRF